ncbi:MAG: hypothetical protein OEL76_02910 [Siculibacillus sp.]|nr:hypothetical protein [Siculibacillus sp.]
MSGVGADDRLVETLRKAAEAPAMQGHDAEARMRAPDAEARWRRLFFDPAGREEGVAEVSCDHRAARRPDLDGGPAAVAILWDPTSGRILLRRWEASEGAAIDVEALLLRLAEGAPAGARTDALAFRRCR